MSAGFIRGRSAALLRFVGVMLIGLWAALASTFFGSACGQPDTEEQSGPQATIALISPMSPLGLSYGEHATLLLRYRQKGQEAAGVVLTLHIDGDNTGATLSADRIVTNDHGEASVLFTAGAAEAAFHVLASAPLAQDLVIDVAVSKFAFGNLDVLVDATEVPGSVTLLRAALIAGSSCSALPPMPMLGPVLRLQQATERVATLPFPTLLVRSYSVIGRAEDASKRLLAYGCVDIPDSLLRTGLRPVVPVPLGLVFPSPLGSYALTLKLKTQPASPSALPIWEQLACSVGLGQVLLNTMLDNIASSDAALAMRISAQRAPLDSNGCRVGNSKLDERLHGILAATSAGSSLATVAQDEAAVQKNLVLNSTLDVYAVTPNDLLGAHSLDNLTLATSSHMATYNLAGVPVPSVTELPLTQNGAALTIPEHGLTLRLPALWRRALDELILMPRGIAMTPQQLYQSAIATAQSGAMTGCAAVEAVVCTGVTSCAILSACTSAKSAAASALGDALADVAPPDLDFYVSQTLTMEDPMGTLEAQTLDAGQVSGRVTTAAGTASFTGTATGTRNQP